MKNNRKNESYTSAWDTANSWPVHDTSAAAVVETVVPSEDIKTPPGYVKYRAIYEFSARNADEITFQPGDIVMVSILSLLVLHSTQHIRAMEVRNVFNRHFCECFEQIQKHFMITENIFPSF